MADNIELLFRLRADSAPAIGDLKKLRTAFESEINLIKRVASQPIQLKVASAGTQADAHVKEFKRIEGAAKASSREQEREQRRLNGAVESLQRQRSAALIRLFKQEEAEAKKSAREIERAHKQAIESLKRSFSNLGSSISSLGRTLAIGLTAPLVGLGVAAVRSARDLDSQVNTLRAFTGSAEAAERRLRELIATAQKTPGLTTSLAATLDAQLRTAQVTEETINRVLPAIGRLNAVSRLGDPQKFAQNLTQLVTQNFERIDLKELVGQSPIAGQIITELFNVDSPTNAEAIRAAAQKMGLTTTEAFFTAFAEAAQRNQALANVTESIGSRLEKLGDRIGVALRPLGLAILEAITPAINALVPLLERMGQAFASLPQPVQLALIVIAGIAAALGPVLFVLGSIITSVISVAGVIGAAATAVGGFIPLVAILGGFLASLALQFTLMSPLILAVGVAIATLHRAWEENVGGIRDTVISAFTEIQSFLSRIGEELLNAYRRIGPELEATIQSFLNAIRGFWQEHGQDIVRTVRETWNTIKPIILSAIKIITDVIILFLRLLRGDWEGAWNAAVSVVVRAVSEIATQGSRLHLLLLRALANILRSLVEWQADLVRRAVEAATRMIDGFVNYLRGEGLRRVIAALIALAVASTNPAVLAAHYAAGIAQGAEEIRGRVKAIRDGADAVREAQRAADASIEADAKARIERNKKLSAAEAAALAVALPAAVRTRRDTTKKPPPGPGGGGGGGRGRTPSDDALQRARDEAQLLEREELQRIKERTTENERALEEQVRSIEDYTKRAIELADERLDASIKRNNEELEALKEALSKGLITRADFARQERELALRAREARAENEDETFRLEQERDRRLSEARIEAKRRQVKLLEDADRIQIDRIKERIRDEEILESEGERQIAQIIAEGLRRRKEALEEELNAYSTTLERKADINAELISLDQDRAAAAEDAARRIAKAQFDEQNAAAKGATRPRRVFGSEEDPTETPFDRLRRAAEEMDEGVKKTLAGGALDAMGAAFSTLGQAVGSAVEAFVLFGNAGTSIRKVTAEILAAIARQAAVQAVYELAQGFAKLALAIFGIPNAGPSAAAHFTAAAIYGSIAGIAAAVGRGVAGDSFKQGQAGTTGTGATTTPSRQLTEEERTRREARTGGAPSPTEEARERTIEALSVAVEGALKNVRDTHKAIAKDLRETFDDIAKPQDRGERDTQPLTDFTESTIRALASASRDVFIDLRKTQQTFTEGIERSVNAISRLNPTPPPVLLPVARREQTPAFDPETIRSTFREVFKEQLALTQKTEVVGQVAVELKYPDDTVETKMVQIYQRNGRLRGTLRTDLLGEPNNG